MSINRKKREANWKVARISSLNDANIHGILTSTHIIYNEVTAKTGGSIESRDNKFRLFTSHVVLVVDGTWEAVHIHIEPLTAYKDSCPAQSKVVRKVEYALEDLGYVDWWWSFPGRMMSSWRWWFRHSGEGVLEQVHCCFTGGWWVKAKVRVLRKDGVRKEVSSELAQSR